MSLPALPALSHLPAAVSGEPEPLVVHAPEWELIKVRVVSFGYLWRPSPVSFSGVPHLTVDLRALLPNPLHSPELRECTGMDPEIRAYVLASPGAPELVQATARTAAAMLTQLDPQGLALTVAFGCAGGRHRSVVFANELRRIFLQLDIAAEATHLDIRRPVATPPDRHPNR
jgi:UPF0042 nucleotide-binding protein